MVAGWGTRIRTVSPTLVALSLPKLPAYWVFTILMNEGVSLSTASARFTTLVLVIRLLLMSYLLGDNS
jgi:uncharacterized membrane protein